MTNVRICVTVVQTPGFQLFNLKKDIAEQKDLSEKHPQLASHLKAKLDAWRVEVNANMMKPNPQYDPNAPIKR